MHNKTIYLYGAVIYLKNGTIDFIDVVYQNFLKLFGVVDRNVAVGHSFELNIHNFSFRFLETQFFPRYESEQQTEEEFEL